MTPLCIQCILFLVFSFMSLMPLCSVTLLIGVYGQKIKLSKSSPSGMLVTFLQKKTGKSFELFWGGHPVPLDIFNQSLKFKVDGSINKTYMLYINRLDDEMVGSYQFCSEDGLDICSSFDLVVLLRYNYTVCSESKDQLVEMHFYGNLPNDSIVRNVTNNGETYSAAITAPNEEPTVLNFSQHESQISKINITASTILVSYLQNCSSPENEVVTSSPLVDGNSLDNRNADHSGIIIASVLILVIALLLVLVACIIGLHRKCLSLQKRSNFCIYCRIRFGKINSSSPNDISSLQRKEKSMENQHEITTGKPLLNGVSTSPV